MKNIKLLIFMCFAIPYIALSQGDGLFWSARLNENTVQFYRSPIATPGAAYYSTGIVNTRYLKIVDDTVVEMTEQEKHMVDLPDKYKKTVDGVVVEMTEQEKHMVDLPDKYKKTVDGVVVEMTEQEKTDVDANLAETNRLLRIQFEVDRQNAKPALLKQIENLYIVFLTNDWTKMLQSKSIITTNTTINVTNTLYSQNMVYLMTLRAIDRDNYIKFASEFKLFEETMNDAFKSSISDVVWHD